jgi:hypothetical protein
MYQIIYESRINSWPDLIPLFETPAEFKIIREFYVIPGTKTLPILASSKPTRHMRALPTWIPEYTENTDESRECKAKIQRLIDLYNVEPPSSTVNPSLRNTLEGLITLVNQVGLLSQSDNIVFEIQVTVYIFDLLLKTPALLQFFFDTLSLDRFTTARRRLFSRIYLRTTFRQSQSTTSPTYDPEGFGEEKEVTLASNDITYCDHPSNNRVNTVSAIEQRLPENYSMISNLQEFVSLVSALERRTSELKTRTTGEYNYTILIKDEDNLTEQISVKNMKICLLLQYGVKNNIFQQTPLNLLVVDYMKGFPYRMIEKFIFDTISGKWGRDTKTAWWRRYIPENVLFFMRSVTSQNFLQKVHEITDLPKKAGKKKTKKNKKYRLK